MTTKELINEIIAIKSLIMFDALRDENEKQTKTQIDIYNKLSNELRESNEHALVLIPTIGEIAWINATIATRSLNNDYEDIDNLRQRISICNAMIDEGIKVLGL